MVSPEQTDPPHSPAAVERWISLARDGDREALDRLLALCRPYLLVAANQDFDAALSARLAPSDVVQESLMEATCDFRTFRGRNETELLAWLRRILQHNLANARRRHTGTAMRSTAREVSFTEAPARHLERHLRDGHDTPSTEAQKRERDEAMEEALRQLPARYRKVLLLHTTEQLTFAEVGARLHISANAARKLWGRAADALARLLGEDA